MRKDVDVRLHVIHVMDSLPATIYGLYGPNLAQTVVDEFEEVANHLMKDAQKIMESHKSRCTFKQLQGNVAEEIVNYANSNEIDLVIIGSRGLGAVKGMLMGSVSSRVVHQANSHVLVIK